MRLAVVLIITLIFEFGCKQEPEVRDITLFKSDLPSRARIDDAAVPDLEAITRGIEIEFSENPVSTPPVVAQRDGYSRFWSYDVSVTAEASATIDQWGVLKRRGLRWQHVRFSREEFAVAFNCPNGRLQAGQTYRYESASEIGPMPGDVRWYFIAVDNQGKHTHGQAVVSSQMPE